MPQRLGIVAGFAVLALVGACGGSSSTGGPGPGGTGSGAGGLPGGGAPGSGGTGGGTGGAPPVACDDAKTNLAALVQQALGAAGGACTLTVRVDESTLAPTKYQLVCGPRTTVTQADALSTAEGTGFSSYVSSPPSKIFGPVADDAYIFYYYPSDFGAAVAVDAKTGLAVFGVDLAWQGPSSVYYPKQWRTAAELGQGCTTSAPPAARGIAVLSTSDGPLDAGSVGAATHAVWKTAAPLGLTQGSLTVSSVVVLEYELSFDPENATLRQYAVMVQGTTAP